MFRTSIARTLILCSCSCSIPPPPFPFPGALFRTLDNILELEVVLASGEVVTANDSTNQDLFWACRGGGGNFGVVTQFVFRIHPVGGAEGLEPGDVMNGSIVFPPGGSVSKLDVVKYFFETQVCGPSSSRFAGGHWGWHGVCGC